MNVVGAGGLHIRQSDGAKVNTLPYPLARVWAALPVAFDSLAIPLTDLDQKTHTIGNSGMKVHKTLGKTALSDFIDCGASQGFPSADAYDVHISIMTQVSTADNGGTLIGTLVEAAGKPMAFPGSYSKCSTKETLESKIVAILTAKLSR
ncbi:MAG: hypothetical protein ACREBE_16005 [bacterium]